MKRVLWVVLGVFAVVAGVLLAFAVGRQPESVSPSEKPVRIQFSQLPLAVFERGRYVGHKVRVAFYRPLTPTDDPLVYHFHPGEPVEVVPPTYRLHFASPPEFRSHVVVVGTVEGVHPDYVKRINGVPGVLVLRACQVPPDAP